MSDQTTRSTVSAPSTSEPNLSGFPAIQSLESLAKELAVQESKLRNSSRVTMVIGVVAIVLAGGYFFYAHAKFRELLEPNTLVSAAEGLLDDGLPKAREALQQEIIRSSPQWAAQLSRQAMQAVPTVRTKFEGYVLDGTDSLLEQTEALTEQQFRAVLKDNHELFEENFRELANNEQLSEESLASLEKALDSRLQSDLRSQADALLASIRQLNQRLKRLKEGGDLAEEEQSERRVLMMTRRLQLIEAKKQSWLETSIAH